jgi:hypothetical protein
MTIAIVVVAIVAVALAVRVAFLIRAYGREPGSVSDAWRDEQIRGRRDDV